MNDRGLNAYRSNEVTTAGKLKLVAMMYEGAIRFMKECMTKIEEGDIAGRGVFISKTQSIVGELQESLNKRTGGEVAENLERVYGLVMSKLTQANITGDKEVLEQAIHIMEDLRSAWIGISTPENAPANKNGNTRVAINL